VAGLEADLDADLRAARLRGAAFAAGSGKLAGSAVAAAKPPVTDISLASTGDA
jgi:hypothetical protein